MAFEQEQIMMFILTGITNFVCFPSMYVAYHKHLYLQFYFGIFTFITSFMYHALDSLGIHYLYLTKGD